MGAEWKWATSLETIEEMEEEMMDTRMSGSFSSMRAKTTDEP
jgi:hypothetical protein